MKLEQWPRWLQAEFAGMTPRAAFFFYVGAPLLCGLVLGWNRIVVGPHMTHLGSTGYWTVLVLMVWLAAIVGTRLAYLCVRRWQWPLWATGLSGAAVGMALFYWPIARYRHFSLQFLPEEFAQHVPPLPLPTLDYLPQLFMHTGAGIAFWILMLYGYERLLGIPRYRHEEASPEASPEANSDVGPAHAAASSSGAEEALRARLPPHLDGKILALQAEDHYVRVHTAKGSMLVHYRFRDAVQDMGRVDGLQVHRSFWVRRGVIKQLFVERHSHFVRLDNGLKVPVSRTHLRTLRAWLELPPTAAQMRPGLSSQSNSSAER